MSPLADKLAELTQLLGHLQTIRSRVGGTEALAGDLSLRNDLLFSLLMVSQLVIDVCSSLSVTAGLTFDDYTQAVRNVRRLHWMPDDVADALERLPGFRNVVIHEYTELDYELVVRALDRLEPIERFARLVAEQELG